MRWTVEVTHATTSEEMALGVEAGSREQATAVALNSGYLVHDCYRADRGYCKGIRAAAWVWFGAFAFLAVAAILCGFGGGFQTAGDRGTKAAFATVAVMLTLAALGLLTARAMGNALRGEPRPDARRGFEVGIGAETQPLPPSPTEGTHRP